MALFGAFLGPPFINSHIAFPPNYYSAIYAYGPGARPSLEGSWPTPLRKWKLWKILPRYFPQAALHKTADLPSNKTYIFGQHPHGILAFGTWLGIGTEALNFSTLFPGIDVRVTTLNINFRAPFLREYLLLHGTVSVSKSAILHMLSHGKSVCINIGGGSESLLTQPRRYDLVLRRRKGFVRCALQTGASLVPSLSFGECDTYTTVNQLRHSHPIRRFQRYLERTLGFTLPLAFGPGLIFKWGLLPYAVPINVVIGAPIDVEKYEGEPSGARFEALVDKYHGQYIAALQKLYDDNKEKFAKDAAPLELVE